MLYKLTKEQVKSLKKNEIKEDIFPQDSIKIYTKKRRKYLVVNLQRIYRRDIFTARDYIDLITDYEKAGWTYHSLILPYVYFYKKVKWYVRLWNWIK